MADESLANAFILVFSALMTLVSILTIVGVLALRRRSLRNHLWMEIDLNTGETKRILIKPDDTEKGTPLRSRWGTYYPESYGVPPHLFNGGWTKGGLKPLFRFVQGDPRPVRYTTKALISGNPGHTERVTIAGHQVIPSETLSVYMDQHDYADAYSGRTRFILIMLLAGVFIIILLLFGLYAR